MPGVPRRRLGRNRERAVSAAQGAREACERAVAVVTGMVHGDPALVRAAIETIPRDDAVTTIAALARMARDLFCDVHDDPEFDDLVALWREYVALSHAQWDRTL